MLLLFAADQLRRLHDMLATWVMWRKSALSN